MAAPKRALFIFITLIFLVYVSSSESILDDDSDSSLKIKHEHLLSKILNLESNIDERSREISSKDEKIKQLETVILEKSNSLTSLRSEVQSLQKKESYDVKELEVEAIARAVELEKQIENLRKVIENQIIKKEALEARINVAETKIAEFNLKLQKRLERVKDRMTDHTNRGEARIVLQRINEEQNVRIRNTERALQKAEEERFRRQFKAARYSKELEEFLHQVHDSWLPPWLTVHLVHYQSLVVTHWNVYGRPALDLAVQKALEILAHVRMWARPHIDMLHTKWIPDIKDQWLTFVTNMEPHVQMLTTKTVEAYHESKKTLKPHITKIQIILDPYIKDTKKFTKPYINQLSKILRPYINKAHIFFKPYTKKTLRGYRRFSKITLKYHRQVRANIHEMLKENEFTRTLASNELVWVMATMIMVFPVMVLLSWLSTLFSKKSRRRTSTTNTSHSRRRAKRVHLNKESVTR